MELTKKMINLQKKALKDFGDDTDSLILTFVDEQCGAILHGSVQNLAHSLFALIHDKKNDIGMDLYRILKLVALNIVNNETPYAADFITSIINSANMPLEKDEPNKEEKAMCININQKK